MSDNDPGAAAAAQVEELRRQLGQAREDIAAAASTVARWNARLESEGIGATLMMRRDFKKLREELDRHRAHVADQVGQLAAALAAGAGEGKGKGPAAPRWDGLEPAEEAAQLAALRAWVDGVLAVQYPDYRLPGCWANHRAAWWELGNLRAEWLAVYADPRGASLERALWFHERWLPGTIARLTRAIPCDEAGCLAARGRSGGEVAPGGFRYGPVRRDPYQ